MREYYVPFDQNKHAFVRQNNALICDTARFISDYFLGFEYCFFYQFRQQTSISHMFCRVEKGNLQHLFGLQYQRGAVAFWNDILENRLMYGQLLVDEKFAKQKFSAMISFPDILTLEARISRGESWNLLQFDRGVNTGKHTRIAFKFTQQHDYMLPVSTKYFGKRPRQRDGEAAVKGIAKYSIGDPTSNTNPVILAKRSSFKVSAVELKQMFTRA